MIHIQLLGDGILCGFTYFHKNDRIKQFEDEDWHELNLYMFILNFVFVFLKATQLLLQH